MNGTTGGGWRTASPGAWLGRLLGGPEFTATEVRDLLAAKGDGARARAVRQCLARPGDWLNPPPDVFALPWRYQPHVPRIAFWYARGESVATIEAQFGGALSAWAVERCIAVACARIAVCLNHDPAAYGLVRRGHSCARGLKPWDEGGLRATAKPHPQAGTRRGLIPTPVNEQQLVGRGCCLAAPD